MLDKAWPDAWGRTRKLDVLGVDSGFRAPCVYSWTRANQRFNPLTRGMHVVLALKGASGWNRPAIGIPTDVDIDFAGKRVRAGAKVRTVGIDDLKAVFMEDLGKEGIKSGKASDPEGYCHFAGLDRRIVFQAADGRISRRRNVSRPEEAGVEAALSRESPARLPRLQSRAACRIWGLTRWTGTTWAELAKMRGAPAGEELALWRAAAKTEAAAAATPARCAGRLRARLRRARIG